MTTEERDQLARDIYDAVTVYAGYFAKPWTLLTDHERVRWQRAANRADARMRALGYVRETGRRVA
jgi:hypothetical protein